MIKVPEIVLPDRLNYLVQYCEKNCVADCCGIDAFDFSPLHVASYLSAYSREITEAIIQEWELELEKAEKLTADLLPNDEGYICSVKGMNQYFRREDFEKFIAELLHSVRVSPQMLALSQQLRKVSHTGT
jgi:hypothetical protein